LFSRDSLLLILQIIMKIKYLAFLLLSLVGYSQTVTVNYIEKRIIDAKRLEAMPEFARKQALEAHNYILQYKDGVSLYKNSSETLNVESSIEGKPEADAHSRVESSYKITNKRIEKWYYKDLKINELLFSFYNVKDFYGKDNLLKWDWKIFDETKEINGFVCKKAVSEAFGYYFTAWFTEDIAINAGPEKFDGLPGLILYLGTPYYEYVATTIKIEKKAITIIKPEIPKETVTMAEIESYIKKERINLKSGTTTTVNGNTTTTKSTTIIK
jgi:GLPGLI family protein